MSNNMKKFSFLVLLWNFFHQGIAWNYQDFNAWGAVSPTCNTGQKQSPIDLQSNVIGMNNGKSTLKLLNYNLQPQQLTIHNNGHTAELTGTWQGNTPRITGSIFHSGEVYIFSNAHVHWSTQDNTGTEHSIGRQKYACELHLVHINRKYQNMQTAIKHSDGRAVIGILFQVNDTVAPNPGMEIFSSLSQSVLSPGNTNTANTFDLSLFLPNPIHPFYSYSGSLTTPPCSECVRWIVVADPQPITSKIIRRLRNVILDNNDKNNIRPLQRTNNRLVKIYEQSNLGNI